MALTQQENAIASQLATLAETLAATFSNLENAEDIINAKNFTGVDNAALQEQWNVTVAQVQDFLAFITQNKTDWEAANYAGTGKTAKQILNEIRLVPTANRT